MRLNQILFTQGFGTRRECDALVLAGLVSHDGAVIDDPDAEFDPAGLQLSVRGQHWEVHLKALLMLNKPAGYECSQKPKHHPGVLSLLPPPLRSRGVQPVGRLDADTTGLLLMTDDGALIHRLTSPKRHVPKVYEVGCKHPVDAQQVERLLAGVKLVDDPATVRAAACEISGETSLRLTLTEGKYHQVKRMLAAVGNRVETLHRSAIGGVELPAALAPGQWRWLSDTDRSALGLPAAADNR
ncbi:pseudouridine synthase [Piscinibacter sakaiensis]|uniref:pseudouridine synthase n=1 Tax=Piscinibacter sakaiensis TaxID=1547922 RepID=UPI003AAC418D